MNITEGIYPESGRYILDDCRENNDELTLVDPDTHLPL